MCVGVVVTEIVENFWYKINLPVLLESLLFSILTPIEVWMMGDVGVFVVVDVDGCCCDGWEFLVLPTSKSSIKYSCSRSLCRWNS